MTARIRARAAARRMQSPDGARHLPHATTSMQEHYSSVSGDEVRSGLAKVIALAGITSAPFGAVRKAS